MQTLHIKYYSKGKQETFRLFKQKCDSYDFHDHGIGQCKLNHRTDHYLSED